MTMPREEFYAKIAVAETIGMIKLAMCVGVPKETFQGLNLGVSAYDFDFLTHETFDRILDAVFCISKTIDASDDSELEELEYWVSQIEQSHELKVTDEYHGIVILDDVFKDCDITNFYGGANGNAYLYSENAYEAFQIDRGYVILCDLSYGYPNLLDFTDELLGVYLKAAGRKLK